MIPVTDYNRIPLLIQFLRAACANEDGRTDHIVGMAIRPDVFERFYDEVNKAQIITHSAAHAHAAGTKPELYGVHYVVHLVTGQVVNETGQVVRWAPEVTFFTDGSVWKRFLRHTDD